MPDNPGAIETPKVDLIGGCGSFTFSTAEPVVGDVCAGVSDPNEGTSPPSAEAGQCNITYSEVFGNEVCGTGVASGAATIASNFDNGTSTFSILFVATIGVVVGV